MLSSRNGPHMFITVNEVLPLIKALVPSFSMFFSLPTYMGGKHWLKKFDAILIFHLFSSCLNSRVDAFMWVSARFCVQFKIWSPSLAGNACILKLQSSLAIRANVWEYLGTKYCDLHCVCARGDMFFEAFHKLLQPL